MSDITLYRGTVIYTPDGKLINRYIKDARRPRSSSQFVHDVANQWFEERYGIRARSQTIFCSPCAGHAREYKELGGSLLQIDLTNTQEYCLLFSSTVYDFLEITEEVKDLSDEAEIICWLDSKNYQKVYNIEDLPQGFRGEVMLYCKEYDVRNI